MQRILDWVVIVVLVLTLLFFWLVPSSQRSDVITWIGLFLTGSCAIFLVISSYRIFQTWRGFAMLLGLHIAAQVWLQWQWDLWDSSVGLVRNLNVVAGLLAWTTLVAMTLSLLLLLIFRDASVIALAIAWLGWPLLLLFTMMRYRTSDGLDAAPLREQIVLIVPLGLLCFLAIGGAIAFFVQLIRLAIKEIAGREITGGV